VGQILERAPGPTSVVVAEGGRARSSLGCHGKLVPSQRQYHLIWETIEKLEQWTGRDVCFRDSALRGASAARRAPNPPPHSLKAGTEMKENR